MLWTETKGALRRQFEACRTVPGPWKRSSACIHAAAPASPGWPVSGRRWGTWPCSASDSTPMRCSRTRALPLPPPAALGSALAGGPESWGDLCCPGDSCHPGGARPAAPPPAAPAGAAELPGAKASSLGSRLAGSGLRRLGLLLIGDPPAGQAPAQGNSDILS